MRDFSENDESGAAELLRKLLTSGGYVRFITDWDGDRPQLIVDVTIHLADEEVDLVRRLAADESTEDKP